MLVAGRAVEHDQPARVVPDPRGGQRGRGRLPRLHEYGIRPRDGRTGAPHVLLGEQRKILDVAPARVRLEQFHDEPGEYPAPADHRGHVDAVPARLVEQDVPDDVVAGHRHQRGAQAELGQRDGLVGALAAELLAAAGRAGGGSRCGQTIDGEHEVTGELADHGRGV